MELDVIRMVLPVLVMIGIGYFCNRKQIFDMNGLERFGKHYWEILAPCNAFQRFFHGRLFCSGSCRIPGRIYRIWHCNCPWLCFEICSETLWKISSIPACQRGRRNVRVCTVWFDRRQPVRICSGGSGTDRIRLHGLAWMPDFCRWRKSRCKSIVEKYVFQ